MSSSARIGRVSDALHKEIALLIDRDIKDPRVKQVTISDVEVSKDLAHARVYFTTLSEGAEIKNITDCLNKAKGFFRKEIARRVKLRIVPDLKFIYDDTLIRGNEMSRLVKDVIDQDELNKSHDGEVSEE